MGLKIRLSLFNKINTLDLCIDDEHNHNYNCFNIETDENKEKFKKFGNEVS